MSTYPEWRERAAAAIKTGTTRRTPKPKPPSRSELINQMRTEVRELTCNAPGLQGKLLLMLDAIGSAKK